MLRDTCRGSSFTPAAIPCAYSSIFSQASVKESPLCEVTEESVFRRLQNTISWTCSEAECRDAVCLACSHRRCGESPRVKFQRVSSEDCRTPVRGQTVKQSVEMRSALEFFATAHKNEVYLLPTELD